MYVLADVFEKSVNFSLLLDFLVVQIDIFVIVQSISFLSHSFVSE